MSMFLLGVAVGAPAAILLSFWVFSKWPDKFSKVAREAMAKLK